MYEAYQLKERDEMSHFFPRLFQTTYIHFLNFRSKNKLNWPFKFIFILEF